MQRIKQVVLLLSAQGGAFEPEDAPKGTKRDFGSLFYLVEKEPRSEEDFYAVGVDVAKVNCKRALAESVTGVPAVAELEFEQRRTAKGVTLQPMAVRIIQGVDVLGIPEQVLARAGASK